MATGSLRASAVLLAFFGLTLPLMPVQAVLLRVSDKAARRFPHWYHRQVCRILGITLKVEGAVVHDAPALLVCNHTSWLDIPVLSALAPVSFVAKLEVGGWPFVSALARLQRSIFIDRTRRQATGDAANAIMDAARAGRHRRFVRGRYVQRRQSSVALQDVAVRCRHRPGRAA